MAKKNSKFLSYLGGKNVVLSLKEGNGMAITGVLLDADDNYYFLGENTEVTSAVKISDVSMILDSASVPIDIMNDDGEKLH